MSEKPEAKSPKSMEDIHFEPYKVYIHCFIQKNFKSTKSIISENISSLESLKNKVKKKSYDFEKLNLSLVFSPSESPIIYLFLIKKIQKLQAKFSQAKEKFINASVNIINFMVSYLNQQMKTNNYPQFMISEFSEFIITNFEETKFFKSTKYKIISIYNKGLQYCKSTRHTKISVQQLTSMIKEFSSNVDDVTGYSPSNMFDEQFYYYVIDNNELDEIDKCLNLIYSNFNKGYDFSPCQQIYLKYNNLFHPKTKPQETVLKCGLIRLFFDRFYELRKIMLDPNEQTNQFYNICYSLRWSTPAMFEINTDIMKPEYMDTPYVTIVHNSSILQSAEEEIQILNFFANPIDIYIHVFRSLKIIDEFVKTNSMEKKVGQFIKMFDKSKIEAQSTLMSFDDFFPLFCLVFSYAPPSNSIAMGTFLSSIRGIQYEPPLEYARLFLVSAIEFVKNYKVSDLYCKLGAYDSNDPLGFLQN